MMQPPRIDSEIATQVVEAVCAEYPHLMPLLDTEHLLLLISESGVVERDVRAGRIDVIVCNRAAFMTELHEEDRELKRQIEEKAKDLVAVLLVQNESWSDVLALVLTVKQLKPMKAIGDA